MRMSAPEPVYILGAGMHPWGNGVMTSPSMAWSPPALRWWTPAWIDIMHGRRSDIRNVISGLVAVIAAQKLG